jgi:uncharacterized glyoxalase superfamily protein PhnB
MTMTRAGDAWMPADEYGRALPKFSVNLLVRDVSKSLSFYEQVLGATVRYSDADFAGAELRVMGIDPDSLQKRAQAAGAIILQPVADFPHGWRDVILEDPDGYVWAVGVPLKK